MRARSRNELGDEGRQAKTSVRGVAGRHKLHCVREEQGYRGLCLSNSCRMSKQGWAPASAAGAVCVCMCYFFGQAWTGFRPWLQGCSSL